MASRLPPHLYDFDANAQAERALIPDKFAQAIDPARYGVTLPPLGEHELFNAAVREGFVPKDVMGYETVRYWLGVGRAARLAAGLTEWQAFLDRFYSVVRTALPTFAAPTPREKVYRSIAQVVGGPQDGSTAIAFWPTYAYRIMKQEMLPSAPGHPLTPGPYAGAGAWHSWKDRVTIGQDGTLDRPVIIWEDIQQEVALGDRNRDPRPRNFWDYAALEAAVKSGAKGSRPAEFDAGDMWSAPDLPLASPVVPLVTGGGTPSTVVTNQPYIPPGVPPVVSATGVLLPAMNLTQAPQIVPDAEENQPPPLPNPRDGIAALGSGLGLVVAGLVGYFLLGRRR